MTRCVEWAATGETFCAVPESLKIPLLEHVDVFTSGQEGYHTFRIPGVETAPDGSVIAFAEARKYNRGDPGHEDNDIDMVMKRSTDGGRTWSALEVLDDPGERWAASNPVLLRDRNTDRVWAFYCRMKRGRGSVTSRVGTDDATTWVRYSEDQGVTWSEPTNITQAARDPRWGSVFYGPGGGIQTRQGRLVLTLHGHEPPARTASNNSLATEVADWPLASYAIYSDDHGKSWKRGEVIAGVSESQLVELVDGRLLIDARQNEGPRRFLATSEDGGGTWSTPTLGVAVTRVACAVERVTLQSTGDDRDRIVWTGPKGPGRARLVVRTSYDEGKTFTNERLISDDKAAYSDLTTLKDRSVGVLWERGDYGFITFSRFSMKFLEPDGAPAAK
jgi:sialidase-1